MTEAHSIGLTEAGQEADDQEKDCCIKERQVSTKVLRYGIVFKFYKSWHIESSLVSMELGDTAKCRKPVVRNLLDLGHPK